MHDRYDVGVGKGRATGQEIRAAQHDQCRGRLGGHGYRLPCIGGGNIPPSVWHDGRVATLAWWRV